MELFLRLILNAFALVLVSRFVPGFEVATFYAAVIAALILGLVNVLIRPVLLLLTLPINILTLGIFTFVVNALMLLLVSSIVKGFSVHGFWPAFEGAVLLWLISLVLDHFLQRSA